MEESKVDLSSCLKGNIEELPLTPAGPPLGGAGGGQSWIVNLLRQPGPSLVSQLGEIFLQLLGLVPVWLREEGIEREAGLARESEGLQRHAVHLLAGPLQAGHLLQSLETLDDVERHVDQDSVHVSLHVELFEQNIGLRGNTFINYVAGNLGSGLALIKINGDGRCFQSIICTMI